MLFSAINTLRFLLFNLRSLCPIFSYLHFPSYSSSIYLVGKEGQKGMYVGPEFGYFVILTRDVCIEIDWYCIICNCKSL